MNPSREQLEQWDREHVWHPFTPMQTYAAETPLIIAAARGCFLIDLDGREYLDGVSSLWCNVHGHRVPELDAALRQQLDAVAHSTLLGLSNVPAIRLARQLVELAPPGLNHVFYSDDGATAVEVALKMAFQYWRQCPRPRPEKTRYLALHGAYHGDTLGDVSVGDIARFHGLFTPLLFPTVRAPAPYCYRCPLGLERSRCRIDCVEELAALLHQHADTLAAVVMEPLVQGAAGMITAPEGYLRRVREVTRRHEALLIADEVAVGFGRTGTMFACTQEDVAPDFLCLAKGLTGGYLPLAATLTTDEVYNTFLGPPEAGRTFYHGHTYTGNPLAAAVALANLDLLQAPSGLPALPEKIDRLRTHLERLWECPIVGDIRQKGLLSGIELVRDRATKERFTTTERMGARFCRLAREQGVLLRPLGDVIVVMPPLAIDLPLLDRLGDVLYNCARMITSMSEPRMRGLFITATDTGAGKTYVTAGIARLWRREGRSFRVCKPVATGADHDWSEDTRILAEAAGDPDLHAITPYTFAVPAAPPVAARLAGASLILDDLVATVRRRAAEGHAVLVEGVGGLLCPLTERETVADLAVELALPLIVVARRSLGTLNHTLLTVEAAQRRGLRVAGLVVAATTPVMGVAEETAIEELKRRLDVPILAVLPHQPNANGGEVAILQAVKWWRLAQ